MKDFPDPGSLHRKAKIRDTKAIQILSAGKGRSGQLDRTCRSLFGSQVLVPLLVGNPSPFV